MLNLVPVSKGTGTGLSISSGNALGKAIQLFEIQYTDEDGRIIPSRVAESSATHAEVWEDDMRIATLEFYDTWTVRDIMPEYVLTTDGHLLHMMRFSDVPSFVAKLESILESV